MNRTHSRRYPASNLSPAVTPPDTAVAERHGTGPLGAYGTHPLVAAFFWLVLSLGRRGWNSLWTAYDTVAVNMSWSRGVAGETLRLSAQIGWTPAAFDAIPL